MDTDAANEMFKEREMSDGSTEQLEVELLNRAPVTPTSERDEHGFFGHMDSQHLK
jgi:hypothetical protein